VGIFGQLKLDAWKVSEMMSEMQLIDMAKDTDKHPVLIGQKYPL
jgi:hypothetical protein